MKRNVILFYVGFGLLLSLFVISSCEEKETPEPDPVATSINLVSGNSQAAEVQSMLTNPIEVMVKDQDGKAFKGAKVGFTTTQGTVSSAILTTDAAGKAKATWTLGAEEGAQKLTITAFKADGQTALSGSPITVKATAIGMEAASVELVSGDNQIADIETELTDSVKVIIKDKKGNVFPGAKVSFEVAEGSVSSASKTTVADGTAAVKWTLGSSSGEQTLTIKVFKSDGTTALTGSPLSVKATATKDEAESIELVSGSGQTANVETVLADSVKVLVKDQNGNAFSGATVNFEVSEGSLSSASKTTDSDGYASVKWTLGSTEGTQTLTITSFKADGTTPLTGSPVDVQATAKLAPEAESISLHSGGDQIAEVGKVLPMEIVFHVTDQYSQSFEGAVVNFTVEEGSVSVSSATTDEQGFARVQWNLGSTEGTQTMTVTAFKADGTTSLTGSPITVTATAGLPKATTIELITGADQSGMASVTLPQEIRVLVKDQKGAPFYGESVTYTVTEGLVNDTYGSGLTKSVITTTAGESFITWTLGATIGTQTLTVSAFKEDGTTPLDDSPITVTATSKTTPDNVTDIDGNVYPVVKIGSQVWMAENLKVTHYPNNDAIQLVTDNTAWINLGDNGDAYCYYNNDANGEAAIYGALYTWSAAMHGASAVNDGVSSVQGACPDGWHIPSGSEWNALFDYIGTYNQGGQIKEAGTAHWKSPNTGANNSSGFTALPGGTRVDGATDFWQLNERGYWWSTYSSSGDKAFSHYLRYDKDYTGGYNASKNRGFSVRCVMN